MLYRTFHNENANNRTLLMKLIKKKCHWFASIAKKKNKIFKRKWSFCLLVNFQMQFRLLRISNDQRIKPPIANFTMREYTVEQIIPTATICPRLIAIKNEFWISIWNVFGLKRFRPQSTINYTILYIIY